MTDLSALTEHAVGAIRELLTNPDTPPSVRLRAARLVLEQEPLPSADAAQASQPKIEPAMPSQLKSALRPPSYIAPVTPGRNALCSCGSGLKFKRCCVSKSSSQSAAAA